MLPIALTGLGGLVWLAWQALLSLNGLHCLFYPVQGIDVSHYNGEVDWPTVAKEGVEFVFIKATEGSDWVDARFAENWTEAEREGLAVGAYHFFSTTSSGEEQADNFIATVPVAEAMLPPVIDAEFARERARMTDEEFHREFRVLFEGLRDHYGRTPLIYTTREFHEDYLRETTIERLWVRSLVWKPYRLARSWTFWQYSNKGKVRGIQGDVDLNVYRGSREDLETLVTSSDRLQPSYDFSTRSATSPPR